MNFNFFPFSLPFVLFSLEMRQVSCTGVRLYLVSYVYDGYYDHDVFFPLRTRQVFVYLCYVYSRLRGEEYRSEAVNLSYLPSQPSQHERYYWHGFPFWEWLFLQRLPAKEVEVENGLESK